MSRFLTRRAFGVAALATPFSTASAQQKPRVDLALVLAVDSSDSVTDARWSMQLRGYADAFRSPDVQAAIARHTRGIAVTFVEWSWYAQQRQSVLWRTLCTSQDADTFATAVLSSGRVYRSRTSIGHALRYSAELLASMPYRADRHVIDISGDGEDNTYPYKEAESLRLVIDARAVIVDNGTTINGLPIRYDDEDRRNTNIGNYYEQHVIGGPGAFSILVHQGDDEGEFARAVRRKLVQEIS